MPFFTLSAVPVLPAISYPGILAKFAVPSSVETTFLKIGLIFWLTSVLSIFFIIIFFFSFLIKVFLIS